MNIREALERVGVLQSRDEQVDTMAGLVQGDPNQLGVQAGVYIHRTQRGWTDLGCTAMDRDGSEVAILGGPGRFRIKIRGKGEFPINDSYAEAMALLALPKIKAENTRRKG